MDFMRVFKRANYASLTEEQKMIYHMFDEEPADEKMDIIKTITSPHRKDTALFKDLLQAGYREGWIDKSDRYPMMPELLANARDAAMAVNWRISQNYRCETQEMTDILSLAWCSFTAMADVYLCDKDWDSLRNEGLVYALENECGFDKIDDYVVKIYKIKDKNALYQHLMRIALIAEDAVKNCDRLESIQRNHCASAMFMYGMALGMQWLGIMDRIYKV